MFLGCLPCCGGECGLDFSNVDSVTVTIQTAGDYIANSQIVPNTSIKFRNSGFAFLGMFNGTHVLSRTQHNVFLPNVFSGRIGSIWSLDLGGEAGCTTGAIEYHIAHNVTASGNNARQAVLYLRVGYTTIGGVQSFSGPGFYSGCTEPVEYYTDPSIGCEQSFSPCFSRTYGTLFVPNVLNTLPNLSFSAIDVRCAESSLVAYSTGLGESGTPFSGVVSPMSGRDSLGNQVGDSLVLVCTFEGGCRDEEAELFEYNSRDITVESIAITSPNIEWTFV